MKRLILATAVLVLIAVGCTTDSDGSVYIQASSTIVQAEGGLVQFDTNDGSSGVNLTDSTFKVSADGVYFVIAAPQIGGVGCADVWIAVNDVAVANSNVQWCNTPEEDGDVIVSQGVMTLKTDDVVTVRWSTTGPALEAIEVEGEPLVPSIILSIFQVG